MIRSICLFSLLCLTGCDPLPQSYPPPEQRHPVQGPNLESGSTIVSMGSPDADLYILKDIYPANGIPWRWSAKEPTIHFLLLGTENLAFSADFALWNDAFKITGPVEVSFLVNGNVLDKIRYTSPGEKYFEKPVPPDWLSTNTETNVGLSIDKLYVAPADQKKFGVILVRMGLKSPGPKMGSQPGSQP